MVEDNRSRRKRMKPILLLAIGLTVMVMLHGIGAVLLSKSGLGESSLNSPIGYLIIGLIVVFALIKLKHVSALLPTRQEHPRHQLSNGLGHTSGKGPDNSRESLP
jgi:hypothetical protein